MNVAYRRAADLDSMLKIAGELSAKTLVFDIEPLVAYWDSGQDTLDQGLAAVLAKAVTVPGVEVVCFATNSLRRPTTVPSHPGVRVVYLAAARKPLWTAPYEDFPRPGAVIGDQIMTDGLLARRLGYTFLDYRPPGIRVPWGPRMLNYAGRLARPLIFTGR